MTYLIFMFILYLAGVDDVFTCRQDDVFSCQKITMMKG
jgi:hypothetical protein